MGEIERLNEPRGGGLNLEFGMRNLEFQHDGFTKPDRGLTPRRQGAKGFAENKKPRRLKSRGFENEEQGTRNEEPRTAAVRRLILHRSLAALAAQYQGKASEP